MLAQQEVLGKFQREKEGLLLPLAGELLQWMTVDQESEVITVNTGADVGGAVSLASLERDFDAVFVGAGLGTDSGNNASSTAVAPLLAVPLVKSLFT